MVNAWLFFLFAAGLFLAALFSSAETAFVGIQKLRLQHLVKTGTPGARTVSRIVEHPEKFLATVLLGINFFETSVATIGTIIAISLYRANENLATLIATVIITFLTLIFAELIPKSVAARFGERLALAYAGPFVVVGYILYPFVFVLKYIGIRFTRLGGDEANQRPTLTPEEFRTAIELGEAEGVVEEKAAEMLHNVFEFGNRPVREVMLQRLDVVSIEKGTLISGFLEMYARSPMSRYPVYDGTMDKVVGVLSIKEVLMAMAKGQLTKDSLVDELTRPARFVPESKPINQLFVEMKESGYRMAIVIDEFGGTAGIITLTQLVEEIVGPVGDELAKAEKDYEAIDEYNFQIDGGMRVEEANEQLKLGLPEGDYETVAGFVLHLLGRIPKEGEHLKYRGLKIEITKMRGPKIEEILATKERVIRLEDSDAAASR